MMDIREAKFQWGQRVIAGIDLINDGSYPDMEIDALLIAQGTQGEIVQVGRHMDANVPVYMVEFTPQDQKSRVVGCMEEEIVPAA